MAEEPVWATRKAGRRRVSAREPVHCAGCAGAIPGEGALAFLAGVDMLSVVSVVGTTSGLAPPPRRGTVRIGLGVLLLGALAAAWWEGHESLLRPAPVPTPDHYIAIPPPWRAGVPVRRSVGLASVDAAAKAAAVERIKRDYDEIRTRAAADYLNTAASWPGGLNAFLRQLALLEIERRRDLLTVLTAGELEDLELRESHAGVLVRDLLGGTAATEEQRRAVFRLQRDFDDEFGLSFDLSPGFLLARERARQALQESILAALGDALVPAWLRGEGGDFAAYTTFAAGQGLADTVPLALWRLRNQFVLGRLEIAATPGLSAEQTKAAQATLARRTELAVNALLGPAVVHPDARGVLAWLPR